jgi:ornithine carbamoyltransferase
MPSLLSLPEISGTDLSRLVDRAVGLAGVRPFPTPLAGLAVGIYFRKSSTRTRTSFWRAATALGADTIAFGPDDLQLITGESLADTARVLAGYLDVLVVRTNGDIAELRALSEAGDIPVVNALTEHEHPTQALADLTTLQEEFGELADQHLLYVGEGNSTARSLAHAVAMTPALRLTLLTPPGYGLPEDVLALVERLGGAGRIDQRHTLDEAPTGVDVVYTSRWQTMGVSKADPDWRSLFDPLQVTEKLVERVGHPDTIFLHDLPAIRGQEVTDEVLDGPRSRAWRQAYHKMTSAMAVLEWCAGVA